MATPCEELETECLHSISRRLGWRREHTEVVPEPEEVTVAEGDGPGPPLDVKRPSVVIQWSEPKKRIKGHPSTVCGNYDKGDDPDGP